ncbi:MAG: AmmeMemoRadiSam system protein B [Victivallales bacterium]|nr:AmmeMemoRadiSam system protein B [Victivallales bacterium]
MSIPGRRSFFHLLLFTLGAFRMVNNAMGATRPATVAGKFYPADARQLRTYIADCLDACPEPEDNAEVLGICVPHAGYVYSAKVAAPAYRYLANADFDTAVIIGHDFGSQAPGIIAVLTEYDKFATPFGEIPVDTELVQALLQTDRRFVTHDGVHQAEHSVEVQLPFLQLLKPECKIVPALFGEVTPEHCRAFVQALQKCQGGRKIFVISSSDMSHYPEAETAKQLDAQTTAYASSFDVEGLCKWQTRGNWRGLPHVEVPICSAGGLGTALLWSQAHGANTVKILRQANSSDVGGPTNRVVGYASMVFLKSQPQPEVAPPAPAEKAEIPQTTDAQAVKPAPAEPAITIQVQPVPEATATVKAPEPAPEPEPAPTPEPEPVKQTPEPVKPAPTPEPEPQATNTAVPEEDSAEHEFSLPPEVHRVLLDLARLRITGGAKGKPWQMPDLPDLPELQEPGAVFVTLTRNGQLRGCIGTTSARLPLCQAVSELAFAAAFQDRRFMPVEAGELKELRLEISVLSPLERVDSAEDIVPGKHGVVVRRQGRSGLFLPQVWKQLPDKEHFLNVLCTEKAGLPADCWRQPETELLVFTVHSFSE